MHLFASIIDSIEVAFPALEHYKYLFLFVATCVEGFNSIILAGFLASLGTVAIIPVLVVVIVADFLNGMAWYLVGYFGGAGAIDRWVRKDKKGNKVIETVEKYFHRYSGRAIILTKLTWGLTIATMVMAGSLKYNIKKFSYYNFLGGLGWVALTFTVGYVFGKGYKSVALVNNIGLVIAFFAGAILLVYLFKVIFKSQFIQSLTAMERLRDLGDKLRDGIDKLVS
ncbi:MAG: VTT domain-containing protein [Candidatus Pacebacteria bacterium]|nr:VTT domain-containing protein [Candidatus Paceibacterota bacterium]